MEAATPQELVIRCLRFAEESVDDELAAALGQLVALECVRWSDETDSAAIRRRGRRYELLFSQAFVETWIWAEDELLFVLLHELFHKLNRDLVAQPARREVERLAANIVYDVRINRELLRPLVLSFAGETLLERLYGTAPWPGALLCPPGLLAQVPPSARRRHPQGAATPPSQKRRPEPLALPAHDQIRTYLARRDTPTEILEHATILYRLLWDPRYPVTTEELIAWLARLLGDPPTTRILFLGDHGAPDDTTIGDPAWLDELADRLARPLHGALSGKLKGPGGSRMDLVIQPERAPDPHTTARILRELRAALEHSSTSQIRASRERTFTTTVPRPGRRDLMWLALGVPPAFYHPCTQRVTDDHRRLHLYVDVSGSMDEHLPFVYGLVLYFGELLGRSAFLFSTEVHEVPVQELLAGQCTTTGGTDVDIVIQTAAQRGHRRIVLLTDGYWSVAPASLRLLRTHHIELYVILTEDHSLPDELTPHVAKVWRLGW